MKICDTIPCGKCDYQGIPYHQLNGVLCRMMMQDYVDRFINIDSSLQGKNHSYTKTEFYDSYIDDFEEIED